MTIATEVAAALKPIVGGRLPIRLKMWDDSVTGPPDAPLVTVKSSNVLRRLLWNPSELGLAQAYILGEIDGDPKAVLEQVRAVPANTSLREARRSPANIARLLELSIGLGAIGRRLPPPENQARIGGRLHSPRRDRAVISHHYDLPPEFYSRILDPTMTYSCAFFTRNIPGTPADPGYGLEQAQIDKLNLVCDKVGLEPGMRLLDIGCGWGGLSLHAAQHYGAQVTGVTISRQQKAYIDAQATRRGLGGAVEIKLQDYRYIDEADFDAIVSLEMGEHVGEKNYEIFAGVLCRRAARDARILIQQMSRRRGRHAGGGPFIESFIAPDMTMRPVGETISYFERTGLEVVGVQNMREHYAWTVDEWSHNLDRQWHEVVETVGVATARVWKLYLAGGGMAFRQGRMGVDQILMKKSR
ncbi:SAM-dependent methyltransferase [Nocardia suismassiliense]|uniref:SAM-dependent methyltransferase n=1 Tax=Nocardia suismassiliense TaxID=2077092 RepID=UPI000D1FD740|nr:cyclopropane-fatty-acyl-phospholipid synthase family protein [Nocardia suismassiliense]